MVDSLDALEQLKWSVQALAADAETQQRLFPVYACTMDELVLDFDNWFKATRWRDDLAISSDQSQALESIDRLIESMSREAFADGALQTHHDWQTLRAAAAKALRAFA